MTYRRFSGWEPAESTEYEYDEAGRLIRSVTTREPEWDEQERAWMLALAEHESRLCPLCGRPLSVCTDPATEGRWKTAPPTRCYATTSVIQARKPYDEKSAEPRALMFSASAG